MVLNSDSFHGTLVYLASRPLIGVAWGIRPPVSYNTVVESPQPSLGLVDVRVSGLRPAVLTHPKPQTVRRGEAAIVPGPFKNGGLKQV